MSDEAIPPDWAKEVCNSAVETYDKSIETDRQRLQHFIDRGVPHRAEIYAQKQGLYEKELQLRSGCVNALFDALTTRDAVYNALVAQIENGNYLPKCELNWVPLSEVFDANCVADVNFFIARYEKKGRKLNKLSIGNQATEMRKEVNRLSRRVGWRAKNPEVADAFTHTILQSLTRIEHAGPRRKGRKRNETAMSNERCLVNDHLPWVMHMAASFEQLLRADAADRFRFTPRQEADLISRVARKLGIDVNQTKLKEAIKSWKRTNTVCPMPAN